MQRSQSTEDAIVTRAQCCRRSSCSLNEAARIISVPEGPESRKEGGQEGQNKQRIAQSFGKLGSAAVGVCRNDLFEQMLHCSDWCAVSHTQKPFFCLTMQFVF